MNYKDINDYEMVYRIREQSDEEAVNLILSKYEPVVLSLAKKYYPTASQHGADMNDLIQEARIGIVKALKTFQIDGKAMLYTYLSICVDRQLISYCRMLSTVKYSILNYSKDDESLYLIGDISCDPSNYIMCCSEERDFLEKKNALEFQDGNIFELRYNGFSYKEIGLLLDIPVAIIDSRLCKIRRKLRRMMGKF